MILERRTKLWYGEEKVKIAHYIFDTHANLEKPIKGSNDIVKILYNVSPSHQSLRVSKASLKQSKNITNHSLQIPISPRLIEDNFTPIIEKIKFGNK